MQFWCHTQFCFCQRDALCAHLHFMGLESERANLRKRCQQRKGKKCYLLDVYQVLETVLDALHVLFGSCVKTHIR